MIHSDQGTQPRFTSWAFTRRAIDSGLLPSMGSVGDCFDCDFIESLWSLQVELLDRKRWNMRFELVNAIYQPDSPGFVPVHEIVYKAEPPG